MNKYYFKFIFAVLLLFQGKYVFAKNECENLFDPPAVQVIPHMLGLTQIGYVPTKHNSVRPPSNTPWFESQYGYTSDRWIFSDRYLDSHEMSDLYNSIDQSESLLAFTYDLYIERGFKNVNFDRAKFIETLVKEDQKINEKTTTYFKFNLAQKTIASAKLSFSYKSEVNLPVEDKVPLAKTVIRSKLPNQTLIEIGRLAKTNDLQLETIFSALSHHILQRQTIHGQELLGSMIGHAGPVQVKIYKRLGFEILAEENELGKDQFIISMPVKKFLRLFPTIQGKFTNPSATTFMDEVYYLPHTSQDH